MLPGRISARAVAWTLGRGSWLGWLRGRPGPGSQVPCLHRRLPRAGHGSRNFHVSRGAPARRARAGVQRVAGWFHGRAAAGFCSFEAPPPSLKHERVRTMRTRLGTRYEIWTGQQSWFWRFSQPNRAAGSIGAAASEADAVRDACFAIEEMFAARSRTARSICREAKMICSIASPGASEAAIIGWNLSLTTLEKYLARLNCANP